MANILPFPLHIIVVGFWHFGGRCFFYLVGIFVCILVFCGIFFCPTASIEILCPHDGSLCVLILVFLWGMFCILWVFLFVIWGQLLYLLGLFLYLCIFWVDGRYILGMFCTLWVFLFALWYFVGKW